MCSLCSGLPGKPFRISSRGRASLPAPPFRPTSPARTWWTMLPQKRPSSRSAAPWPSRLPQRHPGQRGGSRPHLDSPASNRRPAAEGPAGIRTENASQKGRATCGAFRTVRLSRLPGIQLHYCGGLWRYRRHASGLMRKPAIREKGRTDFPESLSAAPHPRMTGKAAGNGSARKSGHCSISRLSRQKVPA